MGWIKDRSHGALVITCAALGIARLEDLDRLRSSIDERFRQGTQAGTNSAQTPAPRTIHRFGVKIRLDEAVMKYLGKEDPLHMDRSTIDELLHGPFCEKCSYALAEWKDVYCNYEVKQPCRQCGHKTQANINGMNLSEFKLIVYKGLDVEIRRMTAYTRRSKI